ncbi:MAG TPA: enoyl-CoA hydratase/isomerase family protein [Anaerolineae bacterium]|nr:enoyl-CoA hydratase/isomerase family protein [Anaerolineae bacterium]
MAAVELRFPYPHIGLLEVRRPEVRNALDWQAMEAFGAAVEQAHREPALRVLVVTGQGQVFIAGGDLKVLAAYPNEEDGRHLSALMTGSLARLEALPVPTIAALNGPARGGGSEVALACDMRVMAANADLGFVQIRQALIPGWGGGQRLLRLVGYARAMEWLLTGRILTAEEALAVGLANRLAPAGKALEEALALAREIAAHPPQTVRAIKALLRAGTTLPPALAAAEEQRLFPPLWAEDAHLQAVRAFLQQRRGKK